MPAGHPSSLQFYDPINDRHLAELEITPSNRVSRTDDAPLEPTRVQRVAFSYGAGRDSTPADWMATYEARLVDEIETDRCLKVWKWDHPTGRYGLNTRIADPHATSLIALSFAPIVHHRARGARPHPLLCTTSSDGQMKTWRSASQKVKGGAAYTSWIARSVFAYRGCVAEDVAWSEDGSLLAAAQGTFVTVWDVQTNVLQVALPYPDNYPVNKVLFSGPGDRYVVATSRRSITVWDLIMGRSVWHLSVAHRIDQLFAPVQQQDVFVVILNMRSSSQHRHVSVVQTFNPMTPRAISAFELPFGIRTLAIARSTAEEPGAAHSGLNNAMKTAFYAITTDLQVISVGNVPRAIQGVGSTPQSLHSITIGRRTLFDDLFGPSTAKPHQAEAPQTTTAASRDVFALFDAPAHLLPPLVSLLEPFTSALMPAVELSIPESREKKVEPEGINDTEAKEGDVRARDAQPSISHNPSHKDIDELVQLFRAHVATTPSISAPPNGKPNGHVAGSSSVDTKLNGGAHNSASPISGKMTEESQKAGVLAVTDARTAQIDSTRLPGTSTASAKMGQKRKQSFGAQ